MPASKSTSDSVMAIVVGPDHIHAVMFTTGRVHLDNTNNRGTGGVKIKEKLSTMKSLVLLHLYLNCLQRN